MPSWYCRSADRGAVCAAFLNSTIARIGLLRAMYRLPVSRNLASRDLVEQPAAKTAARIPERRATRIAARLTTLISLPAHAGVDGIDGSRPPRASQRAGAGSCWSTPPRRKNTLAQSARTEDESQKSGKTLNFSISPGENS
jgi:hypothetical protein